MRVRVLLLSSPCRELVQAVLDPDAATAGLVPRRRGLLGSRTVGLRDNHIGQAEGDVEGALEQLRGLVDLRDDVLLRLVPVPVEGLDIGAVGRYSDKCYLAGGGASSGAAD